jgi:hypothetical protein
MPAAGLFSITPRRKAFVDRVDCPTRRLDTQHRLLDGQCFKRARADPQDREKSDSEDHGNNF